MVEEDEDNLKINKGTEQVLIEAPKSMPIVSFGMEMCCLASSVALLQ